MHCRVRNIVFIAVFLALIFCTLCSKCLTYAGVEFPAWSGIGAERSYLEGRQYEDFPELSMETIESGDFQSDFEQYMADAIPARDEIMMLNAAIQRSSIALASKPMAYDVYPTFYGSAYAYDSSLDSVVETIHSSDDETDARYENAAEAYASFSESHPELNYVFYRIDRVSSSNNNPTSSLVSDPVNTDYLTEHFFSKLGDRITVVDGLADSEEDIFSKYYRSDHHWETSTAYHAYSDVLAALKSEEEPVEYEELSWDAVPFYGALSRSGLCPVDIPDSILDYSIDLSGIEVTVDGEKVDSSFLDHSEQYASGDIAEDLFTNRYAEYYHSDYAMIQIHNENASSDDALLIVGDSFSNPMERFFSSAYKDVYVFDARYNEDSLDSIVNECGIDDVAFIIGSTNFASDNSVAALG